MHTLVVLSSNSSHLHTGNTIPMNVGFFSPVDVNFALKEGKDYSPRQARKGLSLTGLIFTVLRRSVTKLGHSKLGTKNYLKPNISAKI